MQIKYFFLITALLSQVMVAENPVRPVVSDKLHASHSTEIMGYMGNKFTLSYNNRILAQDIEKLIHPFTLGDEHSCWQGEFFGKWFTSDVLAYKYKPAQTLSEILKRAAAGLIDTQTSDGYIGNYAPDSHLNAWDIWDRKYCMLGLLSYYNLTKDTKALNAAAKEADFLMQDIRDAQLPNGLVTSIAPEDVVFNGGFLDSPEWGSASVIFPFIYYEFYGDNSLIVEYFDVMQR
ncbi:beta-L-arabinofuranosidase domain-containing protein [Proteiniphilum sp. UBA5431]|uniref:alpha-L-rhamnosidase-related protein n=1 Tax=Proteiniphilum sp. UBA5431 TaxID=1947280 RepID=UPI00257E3D61|nr:beta-L-arabinofuranosidase domain-containing protein [Proteiniphilum sp. UBA5431]